ncbi:MAG TPA: ATP-binding cassette domain-containing protein [Mesotoga infera]|jgi:sodium transport system ATP-binding protein|nr:ATP-binding cassette domain-containing protein [Mesotoga sp.]NLI06950.1 ATP-binding cassette domain-containing protein [Thermotogaceae bacterium]HOI34903.1 ATP-binding cassette domain-containing protein [Mesotoga infera]HOI64419.1 ATP-binding cassette domain-containing protein [Mesotoga sp.]HON28157.1 ATP-binding cassette domain-containing protein [Mesotoga infera]
MVEISSIEKTFESRKKKVKAVDGVSFKAQPGRIYGLLGPNGAGKTTTLRIIATLLKPDSGKAQVMGFDSVKDATQVRKRIGFLTSDMKLSGNLTPRELLQFFGELNHMQNGDIKKAIREMAEYLDMGEFLDKQVGKLSSGMKQKAAMAVSLIHNPEVIIFDEPTNGLDILTARTVTEFLKDYRRQGKTIIISTHIMAVAEKLCDNVGIIFKGRLVENDSLEGLYGKFNEDNLEDLFFKVAEREGVMENA